MFTRFLAVGALLIATCHAIAAPDDTKVTAKEEAKEDPAVVIRTQIRNLVIEILKENPGMIMQALKDAQEQEETKRFKEIQEKITLHKDKILEPSTAIVDGEKGAKQTLVFFYDSNCGHCRRMLRTLTDIKQQHPQLTILYRQFPIMGEGSKAVARGVIAAEKLKNFNVVNQAIIECKEPIDNAKFLELAKGAKGVKVEALKAAMATPEIEKTLQENIKLAESLGLDFTPLIVFADEKGIRFVPPDQKALNALFETKEEGPAKSDPPAQETGSAPDQKTA